VRDLPPNVNVDTVLVAAVPDKSDAIATTKTLLVPAGIVIALVEVFAVP
jgi:hypothetical protein